MLGPKRREDRLAIESELEATGGLVGDGRDRIRARIIRAVPRRLVPKDSVKEVRGGRLESVSATHRDLEGEGECAVLQDGNGFAEDHRPDGPLRVIVVQHVSRTVGPEAFENSEVRQVVVHTRHHFVDGREPVAVLVVRPGEVEVYLGQDDVSTQRRGVDGHDVGTAFIDRTGR